jgi:HK97 family phage major capsid protein
MEKSGQFDGVFFTKREQVLEVSSLQERTVSLSFSSEYPLLRTVDGIGTFYEVLGHDASEVDLAALNETGPLLWMHDKAAMIGGVVRAWIGDDKKGRAEVAFSGDEFAMRKLADVKDGILRAVSVGAEVLTYRNVGQDGDIPVLRAVKWRPREISLVSIPADANVGVGREYKVKEKVFTMPQEVNAPDIEVLQREADKRALARLDGIQSATTTLTKRGFVVSEELSRKALNEGWSGDKLTLEVLRSAPEVASKPIIGADSAVLDEMRKAEKREFFISRALASYLTKRRVEGFEGEVMQEITKRTGQMIPETGILVPHSALSTRSLLAGSFSAGGATVPVQMGPMIDKLDAMPVLERAGATVFRGVSGPLVFPRQTTAATAHWVAEAVEVAKSTPGTDDMTLTPHGISAYVEASRQLMLSSAIDVEGWIRREINKRISLGIDRGALVSDGSAGTPMGAFALNVSTSGINPVTFGAAPTWAKIVEFEGAVEADDALMGNLAWITTAPVKARWKSVSRDTGSGVYLANGNEANGYPIFVTSQLASSSFNNRVLFGDFSQLYIALFGALELLVDSSAALQRRGLVGITGLAMADVGFAHTESFAVSTDAGNQ